MLSIPKIFTIFASFSSAVIFGEYVPKWSCDFESGLCDWHHFIPERWSYIPWIVTNGHKFGINDHTNNSTSGKFLILRADMVGSLMSPVIRQNNGSCRMIFYYRKIPLAKYYGVSFLKINRVTKKSHKIYRKVISKQMSFPENWTKADINLMSDVEFQLEIYGEHGEFAIDDILFTNGCLTNEYAPIKIVKAPSSSQFNFPNGVFYEKVDNCWIMICSKEKADTACKLLGFNGVGSKSSVVGILDSAQTICLPKNDRHPYEVGCYNQSGCVNATYWRCSQDYRPWCPSLTHQYCPSSKSCFDYSRMCDYHNDCEGGEDESHCSAYNRCNFQNGFCDWVASKQTVFEWRRTQSSIDSKYYLIADYNLVRGVKGIAILRMKNFIRGTRDSLCSLRFSYEFFWIDAQLKVRVTSNKTTSIVWRAISDPMEQPHRYDETLELKLNDVYQVEFEAEFISKSGGVISLADISFTHDCSIITKKEHFQNHTNESFVCLADGKKISRRKLCDFFPDCFGGSDELNCTYDSERCTFDESLCNWRISEDAPVNLTRPGGYKARHHGPGPVKDHTNKFKDGHYVYFDATPSTNIGDAGYLTSNWMQKPVSGKCTFRWFYNMHNHYSKGMGKLSIIYYDPIKRVQKSLWYSRGSNDSSWHYGAVTFDVVSFHYQLIIKFECGYSHTSDIAVDDVSFSEECYNIQNFAPVSVRQVCRTNRKFFNTNKHFASVFFSSKNYANRSINCKWYISTDIRHRISLRTKYFITDSNNTVSIEAGSAMWASIGGSYSGRVAPFHLISSSNSIVITFNAMHIKAYQGFLFDISSTDYPASPSTSNKFPTGPKKIKWTRECKSPEFSSSHTTSGNFTLSMENIVRKDCINKFYAYHGYRMKFDFKFLRTTMNNEFLEILNNELDGPSKFKGTMRPFYFISKSSWLKFRYRSFYYNPFYGFSLVVAATSDLPKGVQFHHTITKEPKSWNFTSSSVVVNVSKYSPLPNRQKEDSESARIKSHAIIAWSITSFIIAILVFFAIKVILWRKSRYTNGGHVARTEQQDRDIAVRYVPAAGEPPPPYSYCGDGEVLLCPDIQPHPLDATNRADRVHADILPTNSRIQHYT